MAFFNGDTGCIYPTYSQYNHYFVLNMRGNFTPYYARDGRYVGCRCATGEPSTDFYNPQSDSFVQSYEELDW